MGIKKSEEFEVNFLQVIKRTFATNLTSKGQSSVGTETLTALVNKVANIATGKKWASGVKTSSSGRLTYSGLTFRPKLIVAYSSSDNTYLLYEEYSGSPNYINYVSMRASNDSNYFPLSDAIITSTSFDVRVRSTIGYSYSWWAFE